MLNDHPDTRTRRIRGDRRVRLAKGKQPDGSHLSGDRERCLRGRMNDYFGSRHHINHFVIADLLAP